MVIRVDSLPAPKACAWVVKRISATSKIKRKFRDDIAMLKSSIDKFDVLDLSE